MFVLRRFFIDSLNARRRLLSGWIIFLTIIALGGCGNNANSVALTKANGSQVASTKAERIAQVTHILTRYNSLPSDILDAYFDEKTVGGPDPSGFGPVDYISFMYFRVSPDEMSKWNRLLIRELGYVPNLNPDENYPWWLNGKDMKDFEFFEPHPLSSRDGFVAISRKTGEIWIYGFTL